MSVYRFKVYFEEDESIIREIDIKSTQTFEDFHNIIQTAVGFDSVHPASFYVSSDTWRRGKEIVLLHKKHSNGLKGTWMHETKIATFVEDPHQKFIYEFDPDGANWLLPVELMKIIPDASVTYPRINKSVGIAPQQYKVTSPLEIPPVEDDGEEVTAIVDDSEDTYVHPETAEHNGSWQVEEEEGPVPRMLVKEVAMEMPEEEAVEEPLAENEMEDDEDENQEQHEEDFI